MRTASILIIDSVLEMGMLCQRKLIGNNLFSIGVKYVVKHSVTDQPYTNEAAIYDL